LKKEYWILVGESKNENLLQKILYEFKEAGKLLEFNVGEPYMIYVQKESNIDDLED
jgi:hypothetical protein